MRLMVVEDNKTNLLVLAGILKKFPECEVESFVDPMEAIDRAEETLFDLIVVDYMMPELDGRGLISRLRRREDYKHIPMVMITADGNRQTRIEAITAGATDFLNKPVDPVELRARVGNLLTMRRQQRELADRTAWLATEVERATRTLVRQEEEVIWRLSRALEYRDGDTGVHTNRVANVSRLIAEAMGLSEAACRTIYLAAPLHDIGKVAIPDQLLSKPGKLTENEAEVMRQHVPIGEAILSDASSELIRVASRIAASHHERWDGTGYPHRAQGEAIPIEGRIAAVADVFDALCSERPYKQAWPLEDAKREIQNGSGTQFDPACVKAFEQQWHHIEALYSHTLNEQHDVAKALAVLSA